MKEGRRIPYTSIVGILIFRRNCSSGSRAKKSIAFSPLITLENACNDNLPHAHKATLTTHKQAPTWQIYTSLLRNLSYINSATAYLIRFQTTNKPPLSHSVPRSTAIGARSPEANLYGKPATQALGLRLWWYYTRNSVGSLLVSTLCFSQWAVEYCNVWVYSSTRHGHWATASSIKDPKGIQAV